MVTGNDNVSWVVMQLLKGLEVKISSSYVIERLKSNPFFPSFRSVSDFLQELSIDHRILRLSVEELVKAGGSFIAHTNERGGLMYYVCSISNEKVVYSDYGRGEVTMSAEEFFSKWSGVALFAGGNNSTEPEQLRHHREERLRSELIRYGLFLSLLLLLLRLITEGYGLSGYDQYRIASGYIYYFTKLTGFTFCYFLVIHELKIPSAFVSRLCHVSKNADCSSVTRSGVATLYGGISMADIGFAYFGGALLSMIVSPFYQLISSFSIFSLVILPLPVFLILYQVIKIRKWCPLCMGVQAIVIVEGSLALYFISDLTVVFQGLFVLTASMLIVFLLLFYYRNYYQLRVMYLKERIVAQRMKRDPVIIDAMLKRSNRIDIPDNKYNLVLGEENSVIRLTLFLTLHCGGCLRVYNQIRGIISSRNYVSVHFIIGTTHGEKEDRFLGRISASFLAGDRDSIMLYLDNWFNHNESEGVDFVPSAGEFADYNNNLFETYDIKQVPALFINSYRMPEELDVKELLYYFEYLEEKTFIRNFNEKKGEHFVIET